MEITPLTLGPFGVNSYVVKAGNEAFVVDPAGEPQPLLDAVGEAKLLFIVNTHGHADHTYGNGALLERVGVPILISEKDAPLLTDPVANLSIPFGWRVTSPPADRTLKEKDRLEVGDASFTVWELPGHSPGGIALVTDGAAFVGDILFYDSIGRTDFPHSDHPAMVASLGRLLTLPDETVIYPGHGPSGKLSEVKRVNPWLKELSLV